LDKTWRSTKQQKTQEKKLAVVGKLYLLEATTPEIYIAQSKAGSISRVRKLRSIWKDVEQQLFLLQWPQKLQ
jgi:hypothetical protein